MLYRYDHHERHVSVGDNGPCFFFRKILDVFVLFLFGSRVLPQEHDFIRGGAAAADGTATGDGQKQTQQHANGGAATSAAAVGGSGNGPVVNGVLLGDGGGSGVFDSTAGGGAGGSSVGAEAGGEEEGSKQLLALRKSLDDQVCFYIVLSLFCFLPLNYVSKWD